MDFVHSYCTTTVHLDLSIIIFSQMNPLPDSTDDTPDQHSTSPTSPLYSADTSAGLSFLIQHSHHCCLSCWETRASCDEKLAHSVKFHPATCSFLVSQVSPCIWTPLWEGSERGIMATAEVSLTSSCSDRSLLQWGPWRRLRGDAGKFCSNKIIIDFN